MAFSLIAPTGNIIRSKTAKRMSELTGLHPKHICSLKCGAMRSVRGFVSLHKSAAERRKRSFTRIMDLGTGEEFFIGASAAKLARERGLSPHGLYELIAGKVVCYRSLVLKSTYENTHRSAPVKFS